MRDTIGMLAAAALALSACGLLEPAAPPARTVGEVAGTAVLDEPLPHSQTPDPSIPESPETPDSPFPGYTLAWQDEFSGTTLESSELGRGQGHVAKRPERGRRARGGRRRPHVHHLHRRGRRPPCRSHQHEGQFRGAVPGYYEARVRFADGYGQWCWFFLYPATMGRPSATPVSPGSRWTCSSIARPTTTASGSTA